MTLPPVDTHVAHWGWHDHQFLGHRVFDELTGRCSFMSLTALAATGKLLPDEALGVLEDCATVLTLADPRIWPLKLTHLIASFGDMMPAVAAGLLSMHGASIGPKSVGATAKLLEALYAAYVADKRDPAAIAVLVRQRIAQGEHLSGFGTPFRHEDERLVAFTRCLTERGLTARPYYELSLKLAEVVREEKGISPNISLPMAAACLDLGLNLGQIEALATALFQHMFLANALEGATQQSPNLQQLPDNCIQYVGIAPRVSPKKAQELAPDASGAAPDVRPRDEAGLQ